MFYYAFLDGCYSFNDNMSFWIRSEKLLFWGNLLNYQLYNMIKYRKTTENNKCWNCYCLEFQLLWPKSCAKFDIGFDISGISVGGHLSRFLHFLYEKHASQIKTDTINNSPSHTFKFSINMSFAPYIDPLHILIRPKY